MNRFAGQQRTSVRRSVDTCLLRGAKWCLFFELVLWLVISQVPAHFCLRYRYHLNLVRVRRISTWLRCRTCSLYIRRVNRQLTRTTLTSDESPPTKRHWRSKSSLHTCRSLVTFINCRKIKLSGLGFGLDVNQPFIDKIYDDVLIWW